MQDLDLTHTQGSTSLTVDSTDLEDIIVQCHADTDEKINSLVRGDTPDDDHFVLDFTDCDYSDLDGNFDQPFKDRPAI